MDAVDVTTIICPGCGAELAAAASRCQKCGGATAPVGSADSKAKLNELLNRPWVIVVLMLHVGLLGIPWYWRTKYSLGARLFMVIASIVYTVAAVVFIVLMVRWLIHLAIGTLIALA